ncbi:hypothetical protein HMPREF9120_02036 [Neisseria sp. oral taxon 020 str. F0370]|nr:hypothetical protein HMPREF9120_02036 [Neisseria sp. oral taxon 020 str. F0370]
MTIPAACFKVRAIIPHLPPRENTMLIRSAVYFCWYRTSVRYLFASA